MSESRTFRLVTRSDFDGLVCAVLLRELGMLDDILFVHPKDMQDGKIEIGPNDITTNLPYVPGCHLAFDHHHSETLRLGEESPSNHVIDPSAPSAARVVFDHYGGAETFPTVSKAMMDAVDKGDSADFTREEILDPQGWVLMNFLMDARTGLGRFREFRISNYQLMMQLIDSCREMTVEQILETPDVRERVELFREHAPKMKEQLQRCAKVRDKVVVLDLREEETIWTGNRFLIYAMFPEQTTSIHVLWGLRKQNTVLAIGNSIINRTSTLDVGRLCLKYGGGGHRNAGTCQVDNDAASHTLSEVVEAINAGAAFEAMEPTAS